MEIAKTILQQLGGSGRLAMMTGANNFVAHKNGVTFKIKNRKVNFIKITLNSRDLYDVYFYKLVGTNLKLISEHNDIYFDELIPLFEKETGMYLSFYMKGGKIKNDESKDMIFNQLKQIHHHEEELRQIIAKDEDIEPWVIAKMARATSDLADVTHYEDGKTDKMAKGGVIKNITKQLDELGVKYTLSKSKVRLFDEIIKPIGKDDNFYNRFDKIIDLNNLEGVVKTKMSRGGEVKGLKEFINESLKKISFSGFSGYVYFNDTKFTSLGNLKNIAGGASFNDSKITDLGDLTTIDNYADFRDSKIKNLGQLSTIGGNAFFGRCEITDLGNLTTIGGDAEFQDSQVTDLGNLTSIGGLADFQDSQVTDLSQLTTIVGSANFRFSQVTDLGQLTTIGGGASFGDSQIKDLGNLTTIGGDIYFGNRTDLQAEWESKKGGKMSKKVVGIDKNMLVKINCDVYYINQLGEFNQEAVPEYELEGYDLEEILNDNSNFVYIDKGDEGFYDVNKEEFTTEDGRNTRLENEYVIMIKSKGGGVEGDYSTKNASRDDVYSLINMLDNLSISYDLDGPNELIGFDMTELDREQQEQAMEWLGIGKMAHGGLVSKEHKTRIKQLVKSIPKRVYDDYDDGELPYELLVYANENDELEVSAFVSFKNITELDKVIDKIITKHKNKLNKIDFKWSESIGSFDQFTIYSSKFKKGGEIEDKIKRVFSSNKMKAYDSEDVLMSTIKERGKDIKIKDSYGETYLVNKVILENGKKGYVWSDNQKFEQGGSIEELKNSLKNDFSFTNLFLPNERPFFLKGDTKVIENKKLIIITDGHREIVFSSTKPYSKLKKLGNATNSTKELFKSKFNHGGKIDEDEVYIEFLNKEKGFKKDIKHFKSYKEAVKWARENFDRFDSDMIKYKMAKGGEIENIKVGDEIYARWTDSSQWTLGTYKGETKNGFEVYDRTIERPEYIEFYPQISKLPHPYGDEKTFYSKKFKDRNYKNYHFIKEIQESNYKKGGKTSSCSYEDGGEIEDDKPIVYIQDINSMNYGQWIDLSKYKTGRDVMYAIADLMLKWSKQNGEQIEEVSVVDYDNIPRNLTHEWMGEKDYDLIIKGYELSKERDIPFMVIGEMIGDYSHYFTDENPADLNEFFEERYYGHFDNNTELAYDYVDNLVSIQNLPENQLANNFNYENYGQDERINMGSDNEEEFGYDKLSDYELAEELIENDGGIRSLSQNKLEMYFDYEAFGDYLSSDYSEYDGYYFRNN